MLKQLAPRYKPRFVIWQLFEGNDLADATRYAFWKDQQPRESLKLRITKASLFVRLLSLTQRTKWMTRRPFRISGGQLGEIYLDYPAQPDQLRRHPRGFEETLAALREGFRWASSAQTKMLIVFIPVKVRVLGPYVLFRDPSDSDYWLPSPVDERSDFGRALESVAIQEQWSFIDMTGRLQQQAKLDNRKLYASNKDSHLGIQGHHVVAQELVDWIHSNFEFVGTTTKSTR